MLDLIKSILIIVLLFMTFVMLISFVFQRQLIFFPDKRPPSFAPAKALGFEQLSLKTKDGLSLNAWYLPAKNKQPTVIHFHGNAGNIGWRLDFAKQLSEMGYGVILLDYRGYGGNKGSPSEKGFYLDAEAAMDFLKSRDIPENKRVIYGASIGTGVAVEMASKHPSCSLILQSPFLSLPILARYHYPWAFIPPWDKFDSINKIGAVRAPVLFLHGNLDTTIPFHHSKELYKKVVAPKRLVNFPNGNHNDLLQPEFFTEIDGFLQKYCF